MSCCSSQVSDKTYFADRFGEVLVTLTALCVDDVLGWLRDVEGAARADTFTVC